MTRLLGSARLVAEASGRPVGLDRRAAVAALCGLHLLAVGAIAAGELLPAVVRVPFVVLSLTFVPGGLTLLAFRETLTVTAREILYAMGLSLSWLMALGLVINVVFPPFGIARPLSLVPLATAVTALVGVLALSVLLRNYTGAVTVPTYPLDSSVLWGLLMLPTSSVIAVGVLNRTNNNVPILLVLFVIALTPLVVIRWIRDRWHGLAVWALALAVLYHKSLWQYAGFGGEPSGIITWSVGRWTPGVFETGPTSAELLPNALLFPTYAQLAGVPILTQYEVVNPFLVSFIPVALFVMFREYVDSRTAFLGATLFVFAHPFYLQYPTAGRAATPVLFLALFGVVLSDDSTSPVQASSFGMVFVSGLIVSHYGTSYFVAFVFLWSLALLLVLDRFDDFWSAVQRLRLLPARLRASIRWGPRRTASVFGWSFVSFYLVGTIAWYLYANAGQKFAQLPRHVVRNVEQLTGGDVVQGRTAARVQRDYGSTAIELSKDIYILLGLLMLVGLAAVYYQRLRHRDGWDDRYVALATMSLGTFGLTFFLRNWGGGRPMMITLVFTAVLAVVGAAWLGRSVTGGLELAPYAALLAVLFLLNAGVASAVVLGGSAPSNVPLQPALEDRVNPGSISTLNRETDVATHVWILDHASTGTVHGDTFALRQRDWYRPEIVAGLERPVLNASELSFTGVPTAGGAGGSGDYLLVLSHNQALGAVWSELYAGPSTDLGAFELEQRHRIYTTGNSSVYLGPGA